MTRPEIKQSIFILLQTLLLKLSGTFLWHLTVKEEAYYKDGLKYTSSEHLICCVKYAMFVFQCRNGQLWFIHGLFRKLSTIIFEKSIRHFTNFCMGGTRHEIFLILPLATLRASQSENFALIEVLPNLYKSDLLLTLTWPLPDPHLTWTWAWQFH